MSKLVLLANLRTWPAPKLTAKAPENRSKNKRKGSSSNHPFSGAMSVSGRVSFLLLVALQWIGHPFRNEGHFGHEPRASGFNSSGPVDRHWPMPTKHVELTVAFLRNCLSPWPKKNIQDLSGSTLSISSFLTKTRSRSARRTRRQFANEAMLSPTSVPLSVQDSTNPHWQSVKIAEWDQYFQ